MFSLAFLDFYALIRTQYVANMEMLTNNDTEYVSKDFDCSLSSRGIIHHTTSVNRNLLEVSHSLMFTVNVPKFQWWRQSKQQFHNLYASSYIAI
jgi:hypothetical protein